MDGCWPSCEPYDSAAPQGFPKVTFLPDRFRGVQLKIDRAMFHANTLIDSISEWARRARPLAKPEYLPDRLGYKLILQPFAEAPPLEQWALMAGDCVHDLRSALDNLAFALALLKCDPPLRPAEIYFPVFDDAEAFNAKAGRTLKQLPEDAANLLSACQPFHRGADVKRDALLLLHHLDNHDKHRLPQVVLLSVNQHNHVAEMTFSSDAEAAAAAPPEVTAHDGAIEPGNVLIEVRVKRPIARLSGNVNIEPVPAIQTLVALEGVIPVLQALVQHAKEILSHCRTLPSVAARA